MFVNTTNPIFFIFLFGKKNSILIQRMYEGLMAGTKKRVSCPALTCILRNVVKNLVKLKKKFISLCALISLDPKLF
jgi:hypothetical protein